MFIPAKMSRIRIIISKKYSEDVITALHDIGAMQIESLPASALSVMKPGESVDYKKIGDYAQRFRGLQSLLHPMPSVGKVSFDSIDDLLQKANDIHIDARVSKIRKDMDAIDAEMKALRTQTELLGRIADFSLDLSVLSTKSIVSFVAYGKDTTALMANVKKGLPDSVTIPLKNATIVTVKKGDEKRFAGAAERLKVTLEIMQHYEGKVDSVQKSLKERTNEHDIHRHALEAELVTISGTYYTTVSAIKEQLDIELAKLEVSTKLGVTESVVAIEGWIQARDMRRMGALLKKLTNNHYMLDELATKEHAPTKLVNPAGFRLYEFFVKFYSLPKSDEFDPTMIFAIAFPIFFGFMVGDAGYGIVMLLLALFILHRLNHPPKVSRLPKAITGFVTMIVSPTGLRILAKSIVPGSIIAIGLGAAFNLWFGFHIPYYTALLDPETSLGTLLVVSGWIGVAMVSIGFMIGVANKIIEGEKKHAIAKAGWLFAAWGFVILGLNVLHGQPMGLSNPLALASYILLIGGVILVLVFEGARAIMELPSLISHILSYTRLVGILLASVILADVIDFIFVGSTHHGLLVLLGIVILIGGQLFNFVIAMFEPGIQGARLIYVEFFSKFFNGNGKPWKPFTSERKHTLSKFELE